MLIVDVTGRVARLYQEDPRTFVASRNLLAGDLVRAGQRDLATRIRSLPRPQTPAWLVNQLYWHERSEYDALLAAGAAMRDAQQARLSGGRGAEFTRALAERDAILSRLLTQAERLAPAGGVTLTGETRHRVRTSLEAIALRAGDPQVAHGQLAEDVALPGLQALAGLHLRDAAPVVTSPPLTLVSDPPERADAKQARETVEADLLATREALAQLEEARDAARDAAEVADGALEAARLQVVAARRAVDAARVTLEQVTQFEAAAVTRAAETTHAVTEMEARTQEVAARLKALEAALQELMASRPRSSGTSAPRRSSARKR